MFKDMRKQYSSDLVISFSNSSFSVIAVAILVSKSVVMVCFLSDCWQRSASMVRSGFDDESQS